MRIAEHIEMLDIQGGNGSLHPALLWDAHNLLLVDAGFPLQFELIRDAIATVGFSLEQLTGLIFTHQDIDHIGSAKEILAQAPKVRTMAHTLEAPYIDGRQTPVKLAAMEANFDRLPPERQAFLGQMQTAIVNRRIAIDRELSDGDVLEVGGGVEVIHTPGHTPGHICLFDRDSGTLITGDAFFLQEGKLSAQSPHHQDQQVARQSAQRLARLPVNRLVLYHGGVIQDPAMLQALKELG